LRARCGRWRRARVAALRHFARNLFRRDLVERELTDEIDASVEQLIEEHVAQGMSSDEARRAARLAIGGAGQIKDRVRDVRAGAWLDALRQDVHFGMRMLMHRPGFATIAVLTLGVGMGATTAIFSSGRPSTFAAGARRRAARSMYMSWAA
jgi:hypothetical protein